LKENLAGIEKIFFSGRGRDREGTDKKSQQERLMCLLAIDCMA